MTELKLYLFGAPRLENGDGGLSISRRKGLAILAYLALKGQPQTRETLATLFWPDFDQSRALSNLRRELSRLKVRLGVELVAADRRQVELAPEPVLWVDVKQFSRRLAQVAAHGNHFPGEPCEACHTALSEAVDIYTDRFLAGFNLPDCPAFDDWQFFEAEGLSLALADSLQKLIHWYAGVGEFDEAIRYNRRWLVLDALHEPAHRELMAIYARAGQQAAALRQYDECARILQEELGIEPDAETTALYEAIRLRKFPAERTAALSLLAPARPERAPVLPAADRYVTGEKIAVGGQGEVYLGRDRVSGDQVIIKRLRPELVADRERVARFLREGEVLRQLQHPNIVRMLDLFEKDGEHCIVMEYVPGGTLRQLLEMESPLPIEHVLALTLELADALGRAHHVGIVHRDLKPGNVLLAANGSPRLTDFGTARLEQDDVRLTRTGALVGSPAYMSPEALRGDPLDPRSDIWSFGVLLYEMLAGRRPFEGETLTQVLVRIVTEATPSLADLRSEVPPALVALVEKMLAKKPAARPSSMRQVAAALEAIQAGRWPHGLEPARAGVPPALGSPVPARLGPAPVGRSLEQEIRFCRAPDGVQIAYATVGDGPPLVKVANWLSHLEYDWQSPIWHHWLSTLARNRQLIRYDERGCGLSDWDVADMSFEAWVRDLETVVDAVGVERFPLLGISQGAAIAVAYAVRHPERVSHLILYGGYARGRKHRDNSPESLEETRVLVDVVRLGWGKEHAAFRQVFSSLFLPGGTPEQHHALNEMQRISSSPENAARIIEGFSDIFVSDLAPQVNAPALVLHARGDLRIPFSEGRLLASLIPGARFVPLDSENHILLEHEPAWAQFVEAVHDFLGEPALPAPRRWPGATLEAAPQPVEPPPFVAREAEMGWLQQHLEAALSGSGRVAFVAGEAGQGKTSLVQAFIRHARDENAQLIAVTGNCNAYTGQGDPYLPFREILQLLAGDIVTERSGETAAAERLRGVLPEVVQALTAYGPDLLDVFVAAEPLLQRAQSYTRNPTPWLNALQALLAAAIGEPDGTRLQQSALLAQYASVLEAVSRRHPLLLFIDDLQWVDQGSANLLLHLGKRLVNSRILLVGAYRSAGIAAGRGGERHPLQQVLHELQRDLGDVIRDLDETEGRAFVDALLDSEPNRLDESFRATLFHQTQGHPLFTAELVSSMQERGDLARGEDGHWVVQRELDWERLPARAEGAIGERIARLDDSLRQLLQAASVVGEEFSVELLAQLTGEQPATLSRRLGQELDRQHKLVQAVGIRREGALRLSTYRFRHILIQRYLYQELDKIERAYRHEAVAEALEVLYGSETSQMAAAIAHHYAAAGLPERAAAYWREVGDKAWRAAAMMEAANYYEAALAAWPAMDIAGRAVLWQRLGSCQRVAGQLEAATASLEEAFDLFTRIGDRQGAGAAQRMIGLLYWEQGDRERALERYHQALTLLEDEPESVELAKTYSAISRMHSVAWEHEEAMSWGERALALARRLAAPDILGHVLSKLGFSALALGDADKGLEMLREARSLALAQRLPPDDICSAHYSLGFGLISLDRYQEAWAELDSMLRHARQHHLPLYIGSGLVELASLEWQLGRWRDAFARHTELADCLEQSQSLSVVQVLGTLHFARVANELGQLEEALRLLAGISAQVEQIGIPHASMPYLKEKLRVLAGLERHDEASVHMRLMLALIDKGIATYTESILPLLEGVAWSASQGRWDWAQKALAQLEAIGKFVTADSAGAAHDEGQAIVELYRGHVAEAEAGLTKAAGGWKRLGRLPAQARALVYLAQAQGGAGKRDEARATLAEFETLWESLAAQIDDEVLRQNFRQSPLAKSAEHVAMLLERSLSTLPLKAMPFIGRGMVGSRDAPTEPGL
jgi:DNA-binding SARP family transcriptional activator/pimeloyl-ACP methyl ester carboxylesterase/tRNA A-37 threonylcarbamoyl transferase component Bud32